MTTKHWTQFATQILGSLSITMLFGCATPAHQRILRISEGMDKTQVLDVAGNPKRTQRREGGDQWTYVYYVADQQFERDVRFEGGHVVNISMPREVPKADQGQKITRDYENLVKDSGKKTSEGFKEVPGGNND